MYSLGRFKQLKLLHIRHDTGLLVTVEWVYPVGQAPGIVTTFLVTCENIADVHIRSTAIIGSDE